MDVAAEAGITAVNHSGGAVKDWVVSGLGGGVIVLDHDQDGRMDVLITDGAAIGDDGRLADDPDARTRLWRNDGGLRFTDATAAAGIDVRGYAFGGASCDYDGDGFPDVHVCRWGGSVLLRNRGDGTFEDVTARAGLGGAEDDVATACAWGDVDGDGIPDLYVSTYCDQREAIRRFAAEGRPARSAVWHGMQVYVGPAGLVPQVDRLYLGSPDGTFRDVTESSLPGQSGPRGDARYGFQPVMSDVDGDGDLDVFVANDGNVNHLWINAGRGRFADRALEAGVATDGEGREQSCMGVAVGDVDHDGRMDLTVTNFSHERDTLLLNATTVRDHPRFRDVSDTWNLSRPTYYRLSWGVRLLDYDGDGELDRFSVCGHVYGDIPEFTERTGTSWRQRCLLLRNVGGRFEDVTLRSGPVFGLQRAWRGAAFADFDDDGDLDVLVTALDDRPALFRNDGGNANAYLVFRLVGKGRLRDPCGARVVVHCPDGKLRTEELHHGTSFCSDDDPRLFFGLGAAERVQQVDVHWPGGDLQTFRDVPTRRAWVVRQGDPALGPDAPRSR